jgi:hypothetical protein
LPAFSFRVFYLDRQVNYLLCDDKSLADNMIVPAPPAPAIPPAPTVVKFFPNKIGLGWPLCVAIAGPANVATDKEGKPATLHLFLDGLELKGSVGALVDRKKNLVEFDVARTTDDVGVWDKIIAQIELGKWGARVPVHVGVGIHSPTGENLLRNPLARSLAQAGWIKKVGGVRAIIPRGPTFWLRMRRSQLRRCSSVKRMAFASSSPNTVRQSRQAIENSYGVRAITRRI